MRRRAYRSCSLRENKIVAMPTAVGSGARKQLTIPFYLFLLSVLTAALSTGYAQAQSASVPLGVGITFYVNGYSKQDNPLISSGGSFADSFNGSITGSPATAQVQVQPLGPNHWQITSTLQASGNANGMVSVNWGYNLVGAAMIFTSTASATLAGSTPVADFNVFSSGAQGLCVTLSPYYNQGAQNCQNVVAPSGTWKFQGNPRNLTGSTELQCLSSSADNSCNATIITDIVVITSVCSTPPPTMEQLITLANDAWELQHKGSGPYVVTGGIGSADGGTTATAYANGDQVVIAAAGLKTGPSSLGFAKPNLVADQSFINPLDIPTNTLTNGVENLAALVQNYVNTFPNHCVTLTGMSEGGAIAQIVGNFASVQTVTFAAPGSARLLPYFSGISGGALSSLSGLQIQSPSHEFDNYRIYGDQLSLMGQPIGTQVTVTPGDLQSALTTLGSNLTSLGNFIADIDQVHSGQLIQSALDPTSGAPQVPGETGTWTGSDGQTFSATQNGTVLQANNSSAPTTFTSCSGTSCEGPNYVPQVLPYLQAIALAVDTSPLARGSIIFQVFRYLVHSRFPNLWDPPAGYLYSFAGSAGSPELASILLPTFDSVGRDTVGWTLTYYTVAGLS